MPDRKVFNCRSFAEEVGAHPRGRPFTLLSFDSMERADDAFILGELRGWSRGSGQIPALWDIFPSSGDFESRVTARAERKQRIYFCRRNSVLAAWFVRTDLSLSARLEHFFKTPSRGPRASDHQSARCRIDKNLVLGQYKYKAARFQCATHSRCFPAQEVAWRVQIQPHNFIKVEHWEMRKNESSNGYYQPYVTASDSAPRDSRCLRQFNANPYPIATSAECYIDRADTNISAIVCD